MFVEKITSDSITLINLDTGTQLRLYKYYEGYRVDYKGFPNSEELLCNTTNKETALAFYNKIKIQWIGNRQIEKIRV